MNIAEQIQSIYINTANVRSRYRISHEVKHSRKHLRLAQNLFLCYNPNVNEITSKKILEELAALYPDARPALHYDSPYELLVAVILSARCTDERVNKVTSELFKNHGTPAKMLELSEEDLERYIYSCGFYHNKAAHILSASRDILENFGGEVPSSLEELKSLAGVGQKTANVVYSVAFGGDAIAVDTHVFRVSNRLGLVCASTPEKTEEALKKVIPKGNRSKAHHLLIYHGRRVCRAQRPDCTNCTLNKWCEFFKKSKSI